jgi:hypothetical protein
LDFRRGQAKAAVPPTPRALQGDFQPQPDSTSEKPVIINTGVPFLCNSFRLVLFCSSVLLFYSFFFFFSSPASPVGLGMPETRRSDSFAVLRRVLLS